MFILTMENITPVIPELFCAASAMLLLIVGVFHGNSSTSFVSWSCVFAMGMAILILMGLDWERVEALNGFVVFDSFSASLKIAILVGLIASLTLSLQYLHQEGIARFEYPVLVLLAGIGMMLMVSANNMLSLYMALELQSLSLYVLAAIQTKQLRSSEAGIKYFILGALSSGMLLFGISLIYGATGSIDFATIASSLDAAGTSYPALIVGMVFVLIAIGFKVSAVPFHMWTPDVYEGAPSSVTALFAIVPKLAAIALLMRLLFEPFASLVGEWQQIIWVLSVASMVVGAYAALVQNDIKRLLAYSSIGNIGYALIGLVTATGEGAAATLLYMIIYMAMTAGAFAILLMLRRDGLAILKLDDLAGLSQTNPVLAYCMAIIMFSMSGIPPMAGFFGKLFIFEAAIAEELYVLAVIGVLTSVVAAYYYLRVIKIMFFDASEFGIDKDFSFGGRIIIALSILFILGFIFNPDILLNGTLNVTSSFFAVAN